MAKEKIKDWENVRPLKKGDRFIDNTDVVPPEDRGRELLVVKVIRKSPCHQKIVYKRTDKKLGRLKDETV